MWKRITEAFLGEDGEHGSTKVYTFEDIKELAATSEPDKVLLDVREPNEFDNVKIPGSFNMPYKSHPEALNLSSEEFKATFGFEKPSLSQELIFSCASGFRAKKAEEIAKKYGYENVAVYSGSINDWVAHGGDKLNFE